MKRIPLAHGIPGLRSAAASIAAGAASIALLTFSAEANSADVEAGRATVAAVCAACHGANGVSVSDTIPHLAGQRPGYLQAQLKALKDGSRKNPIMNAIAAQLSPTDIENVAAFFSTQPGASTASAKSEFLPTLAKARLAFPEDYRQTFVRYHTINFPATRQVRYYFANRAAVQAAQAGEPLPDGSYLFVEVHAAKLGADGKPVTGSDGFFEADKLLFYTAMSREAGWGKEIPELLRNEDWNYAVFTSERQSRPANQAECLACHKPLDKVSFTFTLDQLKAAPTAR
jgi:cytochrome c553